jgi:hypothetical protein
MQNGAPTINTDSPKMAEVSRRLFPRSNTPRSIHTPLSLGLRADTELHSIVLFKKRKSHAVVFHILALSTLPGLVLTDALERELLHNTLLL